MRHDESHSKEELNWNWRETEVGAT